MQTTLQAQPGTDTLTFTTVDVNGADITSRCTYTVTSDGPAVSVGSLSSNTASVSYSSGTANVTIKTADSGGDTIPDVVLAATIASPPPPPPTTGTTTVKAQNATIS